MDEKSRLARNRYSHPRNDFLKRTSCNYKAESSQYDITGYPGSLTRIQKLLDGTTSVITPKPASYDHFKTGQA